ncbi:MAG: PTS sugar transporter subunit IIA [Rhodothermales bacterium]|nr:PTS sugar transporter subunit IIA [Rhodothermales bacterium]
MQISDFFSAQTVAVDLRAADKDALIDAMIDLLSSHERVKDLEEVRRAVKERESMMSTGVGKGLALPHAKSEAVSDTVAALATLENPVEYGSIDDEPVRIAFLLVGTPDAKSQHVKVLSRVSRLMNRESIRASLLRSTTPAELLDTFREAEAGLLDT